MGKGVPVIRHNPSNPLMRAAALVGVLAVAVACAAPAAAGPSAPATSAATPGPATGAPATDAPATDAAATPAPTPTFNAQPGAVTLVAYSTPREAYAELIPLFQATEAGAG